MDAETEIEQVGGATGTRVARGSERELSVTRHFAAPPHLVFRAWTTPELLKRWWTPASFGLTFLACEVDARTGGQYRFVFRHPSAPEPMAFFGRYLEVVPDRKLVWTNEEGGEGGAVTTVTFEPVGSGTRLVISDLYPSKAALDEAISSGSTCGYGESFRQLDGLLAEARAA